MRARAFLVTALAAAMLLLAPAVMAAPTDYRFEAVTPTAPRGLGVALEVQIRNLRTGQLVPGAEIRNAKVDRSPEGAPGELHPAFFVPGLAYGVYRFTADLPRDGQWALSFDVKLPGEPLTSASVVFTVGAASSPQPSPAAPDRSVG